MNLTKRKWLSNSRDKIIVRFVPVICLIVIVLLATLRSAFADEADTTAEGSFEDNFVLFSVACHGEPEFIPITEETITLSIDNPTFPERTGRDPRMGRMVWVEPNCSFLMTGYPKHAVDLTSGNNPFRVTAFGLAFIKNASGRLARKGKPSGLTEVLLINDRTYNVMYFTDVDRSGDFDLSEQLSTDDLTADQIEWRFTDAEFVRFDFDSHFTRWDEYIESGGVWFEFAEFHNGPLDGRTLYLVATKFEEVSNGPSSE